MNLGAIPAGERRRSDLDAAIAFGRLSRGFWGGATAGTAWFWSLSLAAMILVNVAVNVGINAWNGWFFNALERRDGVEAGRAMLAFPLIVAAGAAVGVAILKTRETLQVHWRRWLAGRLVDSYLERRRFQRLGQAGLEPTNPEYRIADDVRWATEPPVDFAIGLLSAVITTVTFVGILWSIGGSLVVGGVAIPAYLVLAAIVYGVCVSTLILVVGRRLPLRYADRNEAEARFRFRMMRVRDNADAIALTAGQGGERAAIALSYDVLVARWLAMIRERARLTWITNGNGVLVPVVPLLLAAPKYLSGEMTLGGVIQVAAAFVQVQIAFNWILENYMRIAEWLASARRVNELQSAIEALEALPPGATGGPSLALGEGSALRVEELVLHDREDRQLALPVSFTMRPGETRYVIAAAGEAGAVLLRAVAGQWGFGSGRVVHPAGARLLVAVRRIPLAEASLRAVVTGGLGVVVGEAALGAALGRCGLGHLAARLDEVEDWDKTLSEADRQRIGIARLHLARPEIVLLEDALTALDAASAAQLVADLRAALPEAMLIACGSAQLYGAFGERLDLHPPEAEPQSPPGVPPPLPAQATA